MQGCLGGGGGAEIKMINIRDKLDWNQILNNKYLLLIKYLHFNYLDDKLDSVTTSHH